MKRSTKTIQQTESGIKKPSRKKEPAVEELTPEQQNILNLWEHEVESLISKRFDKFDDAVQAVIDGVIEKIDRNNPAKEKTREFLYTFMTGDPEMVSELKAIFNLK